MSDNYWQLQTLTAIISIIGIFVLIFLAIIIRLLASISSDIKRLPTRPTAAERLIQVASR